MEKAPGWLLTFPEGWGPGEVSQRGNVGAAFPPSPQPLRLPLYFLVRVGALALSPSCCWCPQRAGFPLPRPVKVSGIQIIHATQVSAPSIAECRVLFPSIPCAR